MRDIEIVLEGLAASPGICIGKAYLVDREGVEVVKKYYISEKGLQQEKNRFNSAVKKAKDELNKIIEEIPEDFRHQIGILQTHVVLLRDKMLHGKTLEIIEKERVNAEWALKKVVTHIKSTFKNMTDSYFKERADDIIHVSDRIMRNLTGVEPLNIKSIDKRVILVAEDLSPAETSQIQLEWIMGFITDGGGISSHTGIIARSLQIPAVLGLQKATESIHSEDLIIVDGAIGKVIIHPSEQTLIDYEEKKFRYEQYKAIVARDSQEPARTMDGMLIQVMGNIELPEEIVSVKDYGGDGVGLYRTEFHYMNRLSFPTEDELFEKYREIVELMSPRPVTIRTLDINGDKAMAMSSTDELNPALGLRAIRYCLKRPDVFKIQLAAILRASMYGNVRMLFPMISNLEEILAIKQLLDQTRANLRRNGFKFKENIEFGIMVEVPASVIMADLFASEVDFFSIGTNDLIQYTLAIDRGNAHVAHLFEPLNPAILRMIKQVTDVGKEKDVAVFMCGEMASKPEYVPLLLGMGIKEFSMNPASIPLVKRIIRAINAKDAIGFSEDVLRQNSADKTMKLIQHVYGDILSENAFVE